MTENRDYGSASDIVSAPTTRNAALDGVRALAILIVVMHNVGTVKGDLSGVLLKIWAVPVNIGWTGVQLFFALSGFLITRILIDSKGSPSWLRRFYVRRALRIVPLYYLCLILIFVVVPHVAALHEIAQLPNSRSSLWYWAYVANWMTPFGGGTASLTQVWSLQVEEQFYFVWPLVVAICGRRQLAWLCVLTFVMSMSVRMSMHHFFDPDTASAAAYELTLARADAIAAGALVALAIRRERTSLFVRDHLLLLFGVPLAFTVALTAYERGLPARGLPTEIAGQPAAALLSAMLVMTCVVGAATGPFTRRLQDILIRWLSAGWLRVIGKYSYAIYIFHRLIFLLMLPYAIDYLAKGSPNMRFLAHVGFVVVVFAISMVLALISWRVLEQPALSLKRFFPVPQPTHRPVSPDY